MFLGNCQMLSSARRQCDSSWFSANCATSLGTKTAKLRFCAEGESPPMPDALAPPAWRSGSCLADFVRASRTPRAGTSAVAASPPLPELARAQWPQKIDSRLAKLKRLDDFADIPLRRCGPENFTHIARCRQMDRLFAVGCSSIPAGRTSCSRRSRRPRQPSWRRCAASRGGGRVRRSSRAPGARSRRPARRGRGLCPSRRPRS